VVWSITFLAAITSGCSSRHSTPQAGTASSSTTSLPGTTSSGGTTAASPGPETAAWTLERSDAYSVEFRHPGDWTIAQGYDGRRWQGPSGFVTLGAISGGGAPGEGAPLSLDQVCATVAGHKLHPYGSTPSIPPLTVGGQPGCLISPSPDQPTVQEHDHGGVVLAPHPIQGVYRFLTLDADGDHIKAIASTVTFTGA